MALKGFSWQTLLDFGWLVFLLLVFKQFWMSRQRTCQTKKWNKTEGRVTKCEWVNYRHSLWPQIEYVYQVGERDFTGDRIFGDMAHHTPTSLRARQLAYRIACAYQENSTIEVYYNPSQPEQSVLDTTIPRKLRIILWVLSILIVAHLTLSLLRIFV